MAAATGRAFIGVSAAAAVMGVSAAAAAAAGAATAGGVISCAAAPPLPELGVSTAAVIGVSAAAAVAAAASVMSHVPWLSCVGAAFAVGAAGGATAVDRGKRWTGGATAVDRIRRWGSPLWTGATIRGVLPLRLPAGCPEPEGALGWPEAAPEAAL